MISSSLVSVITHSNIEKLDITLTAHFALDDFRIMNIEGEDAVMWDSPPQMLHIGLFFNAPHILDMVERITEDRPAVKMIDFKLVGTASNGWHTESHTLGSVSYRHKPDEAALQGRVGCTTDVNLDGAESLRVAMGRSWYERIQGPDRGVAESRERWTAHRGAVESRRWEAVMRTDDPTIYEKAVVQDSIPFTILLR